MLECCIKNHRFSFMQWNLDATKIPYNANSLDMLRYSNSLFFTSGCFIFPSSCHSIAFYWRRTMHLWRSWNLFSSFEFESWWAKFGKSAIGINLYWCSNSSFSKTTALNFSINVWLRGFLFFDFRWLLHWHYPILSFSWNLDRPRKRKLPIHVLILSSFKLKIL